MAQRLLNEAMTMTDWEDDASITVINPPGGMDDGGENTPWRIPPRRPNGSSSAAATGPWRTATPAARATVKDSGRLVGRYAMYEEIARGGMASVHLGRSVEPGTRYAVAIKRMFPQLAANPNFVAMFLDEGRLAARVNHPNVVSPVDFVVRATEGELYLVMEYIHGETLAHLLTRSVRQGNAPATDVAVSIMVGVLRGLHAAHEATTEEGASLEIIHRDVSPQNIMVGADGVARVVDFGVAKATVQELPMDEEERPGKPSYLAPEQIRGNNVDRRSDVFSAGVVLWELLARRRLFRHGNPHVVSLKILAGEIPPPSHFNPDVPTALDAVVLKAMDRRREHRFASARSFADAVLAVLPPASAAATAAWVEQVSGDLLALRAERIAEIIAGPRKSSPLRWRSLFRNELRWRQLMTAAPRGREPAPARPAWVPWSGAGIVVLALTAMAAWSSAGGAGRGQGPPTAPPLLALVAQVEATPAAVAEPAAPPPPEAQREPDPPAEPQPQAEAITEPELDRETDPTDTREAEAPLAPERRMATSTATASESKPGADRAAVVSAIKTMNRRALAAYRRAEYETARRMLRAALAAADTAKLHRHRSLALTHTHLGIVLVGGFHQPEMAVQQFRIARQIDPGVLLPRSYVKPQVTAAFRKAGART